MKSYKLLITNSGDYNSGDYNSGDCNTGDCNTGNCNTGNFNTGNYNTGSFNTGNFNLSNYNNGCFNTSNSPMRFFDKETNMRWGEWEETDAYFILSELDTDIVVWVSEENMTEQDKETHPDFKLIGGYFKEKDLKESYKKWWKKLDSEDRQYIREIPNFDVKKFEMITGIPESDLLK